jgi:hypothetical protein
MSAEARSVERGEAFGAVMMSFRYAPFVLEIVWSVLYERVVRGTLASPLKPICAQEKSYESERHTTYNEQNRMP